jgi:hypothetical protein
VTAADYADYQTPQAHATAIAVTGVPLLTKSTNLINDANHSIPFGGAAVTIANKLAFTQIGYEVAITALISATAPTLPILTVDLIWTDSTSATTVAHETWCLPIGSSGAGSLHIGIGPTKGNQLTVKLANADSAQNATVTTVVNQNSRVYLRDDWRTEQFNAIPNATLPLHDQQGNTLLDFLSAPLGALGSVSRLLPLYAGKVTIAYSSAVSKTGSLQLTNLDPAVSSAGIYTLLDIPASNRTQLVVVSLPRAVCQLTVADTSNTAGNTLQVMIITDEYLA